MLLFVQGIMRIVRFVSHEKEIVTSDSHAMRFSGMVTCKEKKLQPDEDLNIHMLSLKASLIIRIVRWAEHHRNDNNTQTNTKYLHQDIILTDWDNSFIRIPLNTLLSLHLAAIIFSIPDLVELIEQRLWEKTCNHAESEMLALFEAANVKDSPEQSSSSDDDTHTVNKAFKTKYKYVDVTEEELEGNKEANGSENEENTIDDACPSTSREN